MQAGSAVQDELIDFISASRRDDLAKLLRYAGEFGDREMRIDFSQGHAV